MSLRPFSPLYFIRENKARCFLLMFMIFLGFGCYLGGLYMSNPSDNWERYFQYCDEMVNVRPAADDEDLSEFHAFLEELDQSGKVIILQLGIQEGFMWQSIMGFEAGWATTTFLSVEDFRTFCEYHGIQCDFDGLGDKSLIISDMLARNMGLKMGDQVSRETHENVYSRYTVREITQEDGYFQYYINRDADKYHGRLILGKGISGQELHDLVRFIGEEYHISLYEVKEEITSQFAIFNSIYLFIVLLLSIILAVTINAAFVGMYQKRNYEFAVYCAIGIGRGAIVKKLVEELLWMDLFALVLGGGVSFLGLYLFNNLVLYPSGKYLRYFHPMALVGLALCNVMVILPLTVTRCRQLLRADICEY